MALHDPDSEPAANLLERRWFAVQAARRDMQTECDMRLTALNLAQSAWQRARTQLGEFEALSDMLENQMATIDESPSVPAMQEQRRLVMSAA